MTALRGEAMSALEARSAIGLALVFAFRMLGMFMVLPVLATYGLELSGATPALIGVAIGAYGLTQAFLQIPYGTVSDRIGRRPLIITGLVLFALGAVLAALSTSIWGVIAGRTLQGAGAISAVVMALLSDLTREQHRTRAMAMIGMSIGLSFAVAMVLGPLLTRSFGLPGLFWSTALLALGGIAIMLWVVPQAPISTHRESRVVQSALRATLRNAALLRLNWGILVLHAILMASFVVLPPTLVSLGLPKEEHWWVYLLALGLGFFGMVPFIIYGEKRQRLRQVLLIAISGLIVAEVLFILEQTRLYGLIACIVLFFIAFNILEACLPSWVSKVAPAGHKGTAMGIYATCQFLGAAIGGMLGGALYAVAGDTGVFGGCALLLLSWLVLALGLHEPPQVTSLRWVINTRQMQDPAFVAGLQQLAGVGEVAVVAEETALYIKVNKKILDYAQLERFIQEN